MRLDFEMNLLHRILIAAVVCAAFGHGRTSARASIVLDIASPALASPELPSEKSEPKPAEPSIYESQAPFEAPTSSSGGAASPSASPAGMLMQPIGIDANNSPGRYVSDSAWVAIPDPPGSDILRPPESLKLGISV